MKFGVVFLKSTRKVETLDIERFFYFSEFIAMWREKQSLWDVTLSLYRDSDGKDKSMERMPEKFEVSGMIILERFRRQI